MSQIKYHSLERTSPKGPGTVFIGTCIRCGKTNMGPEEIWNPCENTSGMSDEEALIKAINGPEETQ